MCDTPQMPTHARLDLWVEELTDAPDFASLSDVQASWSRVVASGAPYRRNLADLQAVTSIARGRYEELREQLLAKVEFLHWAGEYTKSRPCQKST